MWRNLFRENDVRTLNEAMASGKFRYVVNLAETVHDHRYAEIANEIADRPAVKLVLIAGPSSSGKTTSSKRLAMHMRVNGLNPIIISLDDYFRNRVDTPRDENGEYDFECLEALDVPFLNEQLEQLLDGKRVEIPKYDFASGSRWERFYRERQKNKFSTCFPASNSSSCSLRNGTSSASRHSKSYSPFSSSGVSTRLRK